MLKKILFFKLLAITCVLILYGAEPKNWHIMKTSTDAIYFWDDAFNFYGPIHGNVEIVKINNSGRVIGHYMEDRAFVWDREYGFIDFGHIFSSGQQQMITRVVDINDRGDIIGFTCTKQPWGNGLFDGRGFLWKNDIVNDLTYILQTNKCAGGLPVKINNNGDILLFTPTSNGSTGISIKKPIDGGYGVLIRDEEASFIFKDHNKLGSKYHNVIVLDFNEDGVIFFAIKKPTNRFWLFTYDTKNQQEIFVREISEGGIMMNFSQYRSQK